MPVLPSTPYELAPGDTQVRRLDLFLYCTVLIEVTGGSFKFNVDGEINADSPTYSADDKVAFDVSTGFYYQDQTGTSTASVTYVR